MNIKEKIKKLLALSASPNENEAKAALLKAKELMAKHKMTEDDFVNKESKLTNLECDVKWTTDSGDIWVNTLCAMLCENYLCTASWTTPYKTRTHILVITGLEEDVELCKTVVEYAVGFVRGAIKELQKKSKNPKTTAKCYAEGFILGLELAFEEQKEEHQEWGLVMVKPKEVEDYEKNLKTRQVRAKVNNGFDPLAYLRGQNDGMQFNAKRLLTE